MRRTFLFPVLLAILVPGCQWWPGKKSELYVINVLEKSLYDDCHIKASKNVPFEELEKFAQGLDRDKAHIILYCTNYLCTASGSGCKMLKKMGFKNVWAYEGGMAEWYQQGCPVEGACKQKYLTHTIEKPAQHGDEEVRLISADELAQKLK